MPRPTPARILYLLVGLVLGVVAAFALSRFAFPAITASVPFLNGAPPTPVVASGPSQFTGGQVERVAALNLAQEHSGVAIRLNTLELYKDGFTLTYALTSGRGGVAPQTLEPDVFQVTDDRGTAYSLSPLGTSNALAAGFTTGMVSFTPAPPPDVRMVRVTVPNALALGSRMREGQSRVTAGPWEFQVPVRQ